MAATFSFDIVSDFDAQELVNAVDQTEREIKTRYDLKDTKTTLELNKDATSRSKSLTTAKLNPPAATAFGKKLPSSEDLARSWQNKSPNSSAMSSKRCSLLFKGMPCGLSLSLRMIYKRLFSA
jgi:hypothetical protein